MEFLVPLPKINELSNVQKYDTYWGCQIVAVEAGVVRRPWPRLLLLEEQLPDPFVLVPKNRCRVCGPSGLNSHILRGRRLQGRARRISTTWITSARVMSFAIMLLMCFCSVDTSSGDPQSRPLLVQDASHSGGLDLKAGAAAHLVPQGSVM